MSTDHYGIRRRDGNASDAIAAILNPSEGHRCVYYAHCCGQKTALACTSLSVCVSVCCARPCSCKRPPFRTLTLTNFLHAHDDLDSEKLKKKGITPKDYERENKLRIKLIQQKNREQRLHEVHARTPTRIG
jgi:hypothetical protein